MLLRVRFFGFPWPRGGEREEVTIAMLIVFVIAAVLLSNLVSTLFSTATGEFNTALEQVYETLNSTAINGTPALDLTPVYESSKSLLGWIHSVFSSPVLVLLLMCLSIVVYIILYTKTRGA